MRSLPTLCDCPYVNGFSFLLHMNLVTAVPGKFLRWNGSKGLVCLILLRCTVCFVIFMLKEPSPAFAYLDAGGLCADFEIRPRAVHSGGMKTKLHRRLGNLACRRSLQRCGPSSVAAWRLSRAAWVYVVQRAVNHEAGWRRARALRLLRRISMGIQKGCWIIASGDRRG